MKRLAILTGILALAAPLAFAQTSTWVSDPNHSEVDFTITHMSISKVHGRFGNVNATISIQRGRYHQVQRQGHHRRRHRRHRRPTQRQCDLKSANYFDVANFPTATFTSTGVAKNGNELTVTGNLTLHGVTKPVVLDVEGPSGPVKAWTTSRTPAFRPRPPSAERHSALAPKCPQPWWATTSSSPSSSSREAVGSGPWPRTPCPWHSAQWRRAQAGIPSFRAGSTDDAGGVLRWQA